MPTTTITPEVELARRASEGVEVSLLWNRSTNRVRVRVFDARIDDAFEFELDGRSALDAYRHPFAYAAAEQTGNVPTDSPAA